MNLIEIVWKNTIVLSLSKPIYLQEENGFIYKEIDTNISSIFKRNTFLPDWWYLNHIEFIPTKNDNCWVKYSATLCYFALVLLNHVRWYSSAHMMYLSWPGTFQITLHIEIWHLVSIQHLFRITFTFFLYITLSW